LSAGAGTGTGSDGSIVMETGGVEFSKTRATTATTTDATDTLLISEAVASGSTTGFEAYIVGREDATGDSVYARISGAVKNQAGTTAVVGTNTTDRSEDAGATTWVTEVVANDTSDALEVRVTGEAAHTIDWTARVTVITA